MQNPDATAPRPPSSQAMGMIFGVMAALIWGAWPVVSRLGIEQTLTAMDMAALRFGIAGLILLPVVWRHAAQGINWWQAVGLSAGAGVPYVLVMIGGLNFAPAGHAGVITPSFMLAASTLGSWWLLGDRLTRARYLGMATIIIGVTLIGWSGFAHSGEQTWRGDLMFACGGLLWASYTVAARKWQVDPVHATALVSVVSMVLFLPLYGLNRGSTLLQAPWTEIWFQGVFQGVFAAILALLFYTRAVAILGAARGALFAALVPGISIVLAFPVLGEQPTAFELAGVGVVSCGMLWALELNPLGGRFRRRKAAEPRTGHLALIECGVSGLSAGSDDR